MLSLTTLRFCFTSWGMRCNIGLRASDTASNEIFDLNSLALFLPVLASVADTGERKVRRSVTANSTGVKSVEERERIWMLRILRKNVLGISTRIRRRFLTDTMKMWADKSRTSSEAKLLPRTHEALVTHSGRSVDILALCYLRVHNMRTLNPSGHLSER
jgi:hypothetical protein